MATSLSSSLLKLTVKERIFVENRLAGLSMTASAAAAGYGAPSSAGQRTDKLPHIQAAMLAACEDLAQDITFSRKEAHEMLMSAYMNAATATEQIQAVKELIALHGIAAPKEVEHTHTHKGVVSLERMETEELIKLADMDDLTLEGEYEVIKEEDERDDIKALPSV